MRGNEKGRFFLPQIARISTNYFWIEGLKDLGIGGLKDFTIERLRDLRMERLMFFFLAKTLKREDFLPYKA